MIKLRPYQQDAVDRIAESWGRVRSVLAVLPTGGGKTVIFSSIIHGHKGASCAVVHRKEIVSQIAMSLARLGVRHRVIAPPKTVQIIRRKQLAELGKSFVDPDALCGVISVQTLTSKASSNNALLQAWINQITLAVFDEGHHYVQTGLWAKAVEMMKRAKLLFVSATPERADGLGLGIHADGFAEEMIEGPTPKWLIDEGFLSRFRYVAPDTDLDVRELAVGKNGDFNATALRARVVESHLVGDVVSHYGRFASGKRAIVFATDVKTAEEMAETFKGAGYSSHALSGATDQVERDRTLQAFERGEIQVLVNVDLFDEGFDVPAVECVILARPTQSLAKFLQMCGRGLRIMKGKTEAIIIDPVRNWERHGMPNWPRIWSLNGKEKRGAGATSDTVPQRVCLVCTQPYEAFHKACPYCGAVHTPAGRSLPEQVDGDLMELDVEAMEALFKKMQAADMPDDEYVLEQFSRSVPPLARSRDLKAHKRNKYRREVLRNLVGWWIGMQPEDRDLSEKHRRFYIRFGIDIGTAFTLKAAETDKLITQIQGNFNKDLAQ